MAKPRIPNETITKAVNALLRWLQSKSQSSSSDDLSIYLILTLTKTPHRGRHLSFPLPLPHPLHHPISLLFSDHPHSPFLIQSHNLPITQLIPFSEFRSHQQLPTTGLLFVDRRIAKQIPRKKGDERRRMTVELDLAKKSWPEEVRRSVGSTVLSFRGGTCCGVKVGRAGQAREEIVENVVATVEGAIRHVPKKWGNVRGFHLKAAESLALPIYERVGKVVEEGREAKRRKVGE